MIKPIAERLSWRALGHAVVDPRVDRAVMARVGIYLFASGAALGGIALLIAPSALDRPVAIAGAAAGAGAAALILVALFDRLTHAVFEIVTAVGTGLVTLAAWGAGGVQSAAWTPYLGVTFYAVYFFGRRSALAHVVAILCTLVAVAVARSDPWQSWLFATAVIVGAAVLVLLIKERIQALIVSLDVLARTDALTGLLNRRGFEEQLAGEIERSNRYGHEMAVLIGDLDGFKQLNDEHGHGAGDIALRRVAEVITATLRDSDRAARLGGDEFVVIAPETGASAARTLARRLARAIALEFAGAPLPLTISVGVAALPGDGRTFDELYRASDKALYQAKGRAAVAAAASTSGTLADSR